MASVEITGELEYEAFLHCQNAQSDKEYRILVCRQETGLYCVFTQHGPAGKCNRTLTRTETPVTRREAFEIANEVRREKAVRGRYAVVFERDLLEQPPVSPPRPTQPAPVPRAKAPSPTGEAFKKLSQHVF